jgi:hypothetical protein
MTLPSTSLLRVASSTFALVTILAITACSSGAPPSGEPPDGSSSSGSSSGAGSSGAGSSGGSSGGEQCGSVSLFPAIVTVESSTGAPIVCDATFQFVDQPDGSAPSGNVGTPCASAALGGCPSPTDAGGASCVYAINLDSSIDLGGTPPFTIEVDQPGFEPAILSGIHAGETGCTVPTVAASTVTVKLTPSAADASADALVP